MNGTFDGANSGEGLGRDACPNRGFVVFETEECVNMDILLEQGPCAKSGVARGRGEAIRGTVLEAEARVMSDVLASEVGI